MAGKDRTPPSTPPRAKRKVGRTIVTVIGAVIAIVLTISLPYIFVIVAMTAGWSLPFIPSASDSPSPTVQITDAQLLALAENYPDVPVDYLSALRTAEDYNAEFHPSKSMMLQRLHHRFEGGYSREAALWAVEHLDANWDDNAVQLARSYQQLMDVPPATIYRYLRYGDDFSDTEAQYAIDHLDK